MRCVRSHTTLLHTTLRATPFVALLAVAAAPIALRGDGPAAQVGPAPAPTQTGKAAATAAVAEAGFTSLFDGKSLAGWKLVNSRGEGYGVKDGVLFCAKGGGGKLLTEREYADFTLRFEFRMPPEGSNNGLGIRTPLEGDAAYQGIELQILDEKAALAGKWGQLRETQYHGSLYDVVPAKRGAMKPAGEWNQQEVTARGRQITVTLNGQVILDTNIDDVKDPEVLKKHPGLQRKSGHIGFLGHNDFVEFRNIRIKPL